MNDIEKMAISISPFLFLSLAFSLSLSLSYISLSLSYSFSLSLCPLLTLFPVSLSLLSLSLSLSLSPTRSLSFLFLSLSLPSVCSCLFAQTQSFLLSNKTTKTDRNVRDVLVYYVMALWRLDLTYGPLECILNQGNKYMGLNQVRKQTSPAARCQQSNHAAPTTYNYEISATLGIAQVNKQTEPVLQWPQSNHATATIADIWDCMVYSTLLRSRSKRHQHTDIHSVITQQQHQQIYVTRRCTRHCLGH